MPGGDGTGPMGMGSMTGRARGRCAGFDVPGYANPGFGRGFRRGLGRGFGRGWGRMAFAPAAPVDRIVPVYPAQQTKEQEKQALENDMNAIEQEKKALEQEMESIKKRLGQLSQNQ